MSRPELQLGFVLKVEDKNFCLALFVGWNVADSELQPKLTTPSPTCSNTLLAGVVDNISP